MDVQRAQDITASPVMVDVTYNGKPVYIQRVDALNEMVTIYPLGQPHNERNVHLSSLREQ